MDVPTRSSYVMAIVLPEERPAAASITSVPRSLASAASPFIAGWMLGLSRVRLAAGRRGRAQDRLRPDAPRGIPEDPPAGGILGSPNSPHTISAIPAASKAIEASVTPALDRALLGIGGPIVHAHALAYGIAAGHAFRGPLEPVPFEAERDIAPVVLSPSPRER